ncbi:Imm8 family immunity protein [Stenotrophomonas sp. PSU_St99]
MTKAKLKGVDTADWGAAFERYKKTNLLDCYFQASIGADDGRGAYLFGFTACNREWLESMIEEGRSIPKFVVVNVVSLEAVERAVELVCGAVPDGSWEEVARKLAEVMDWEFEGYVPRRR